jgi:hypothetical protein
MTERNLDMTPEVIAASALKKAMAQAAAPAAADPSHGSVGSVPQTPPPELHGSGGGSGDVPKTPRSKGGGGFSNFFRKPLVGILIAVSAWILFMEVQDWYAGRANKRDQEAELQYIASEKLIADAKKDLVSSPVPSPVVTAPNTLYSKMFSCSTIEMKNQGFQTEKTQVFASDVKFLSGCAAAKFDFNVTNIEGKNFLIEFPDHNDLSKTFKCDTPEACISFINYLRDGKEGDPRIWVVVKDGGYVTLRR